MAYFAELQSESKYVFFLLNQKIFPQKLLLKGKQPNKPVQLGHFEVYSSVV